MILYHGSSVKLPYGGQLKTPTGHSEMDVTSGGVVYMVDDFKKAARYGDVYAIEVNALDAIPYKEQRQKQNLEPKKARYTSGVWVALPESTRIKERVFL